MNCVLCMLGTPCLAQGNTQEGELTELTPAMLEVMKLAKPTLPRENLKGLKKVAVTVERLSPACDGILSAEELKTAAELRLRSHGVKVVPEAEPFIPGVYLNVSVMKAHGSYFYNVHVSLTEGALPMRNMSRAVLIESWRDGNIGCASVMVADAIKTDVLAQLDRFLNDWYAANAR